MSFTNPCPICGWIAEKYFTDWQLCNHQLKEQEEAEKKHAKYFEEE